VWDPQHSDGVLSAMFIAKRFVSLEYARAFTPQEQATRSGALAFWGYHAINLVSGAPKIASFSIDWIRQRICASRKLPSVFLSRKDGIYPLEFDAEHLPYKESRITLGSTTDSLGMPRIRIDWKVPEANFGGLASACFAFKEAIKCAGIAELQIDNDQMAHNILEALPVGGHHIGTARMGDDPKSSVVNKYGEAWGTRNLFIAGSAIFSTSGFANPTFTAVALALRQSDYIALGS
jgi:choline dehydrogenase-like flavoprotein